MQLVINIDEEDYKMLVKCGENVIDLGLLLKLRNLVRESKPLSKGHGRLIDADELYGDFIDGTEGYDCQIWNRSEIGDVIEYAPTIIEADRSEEE